MDRLLLLLLALGLVSFAACTPLRLAGKQTGTVHFDGAKPTIGTADDWAFWQQRSRDFAPVLDSLARN